MEFDCCMVFVKWTDYFTEIKPEMSVYYLFLIASNSFLLSVCLLFVFDSSNSFQMITNMKQSNLACTKEEGN